MDSGAGMVVYVMATTATSKRSGDAARGCWLHQSAIGTEPPR
jgi:hypothetical protein